MKESTMVRLILGAYALVLAAIPATVGICAAIHS